jgi:hypothetical protein
MKNEKWPMTFFILHFSFCILFCQRDQRELKRKTRHLILVLPGQLPAVPLGDLSGDKQPQSEAIGLGGHKRIEQLVAHLHHRTGARILHAKLPAIVAIAKKSYRNGRRNGFAGYGRIQCIENQVRHKLPQRLRVALKKQ